jgi:hypothetical protein
MPNAEALREFLYDPRSPTTVPDEAIVNNEQFFPTSVCEELWKLQGDVERWLINTPVAPPHALLLVDREPERNPRVFIRGNPARQGEEVPRQFPAIVAGRERRPFQHGSGRPRTRPSHCSTRQPAHGARHGESVFGNIISGPASCARRAISAPERRRRAILNCSTGWQGEFIKSGWSVKAMHRLVMSSAVYQQSSAPARTSSADPENRLLAYFPRQRLDFEEVRDTMLAASGELDERLGGKPAELFRSRRTNAARSTGSSIDSSCPARFESSTLPIPTFTSRSGTTPPCRNKRSFFSTTRSSPLARMRSPRAPAEAAPEERVIQFYRALYQRPPTEQGDGRGATLHRFRSSRHEPSPSGTDRHCLAVRLGRIR